MLMDMIVFLNVKPEDHDNFALALEKVTVTNSVTNVTEKRPMTGAERTAKWRANKEKTAVEVCDENVTKESTKENIYILNNSTEELNNSYQEELINLTPEELNTTEDLSLSPKELNINLTGELKEKEIKKEKEKNRDERRHRREQKKFGKNAFGQFQNVFLTDEELGKFQKQFPLDWEQRIETMSAGIASKGYNYKNHYAALLGWARRSNKTLQNVTTPSQPEQPKRKSWAELGREMDARERGEVIDL